MNFISIISLVLLFSSFSQCSFNLNGSKKEVQPYEELLLVPKNDLTKYHKAYFASGCFWCVEAIFESVIGVEEVVSGYAGGTAQHANYKAVSAGYTDHAEAVEVYYDTSKIDYPTLLQVFYGSHDPTSLNSQGPDRGRQYRSAIFYQNETEKELALAYKNQLDNSDAYAESIVTEMVPLDVFYPAEDYHQDFERRNPNQGYVQSVSIPRLNQFKRKFPELLKQGVRSH